MTEPPSFYRQEALNHQTGSGLPSKVLRVTPPWTRWLYWIVLGLLVAIVATAFLVRVDRTVSGVAVIDNKRATFTALVPVGDPAAIPLGRRVRLQMGGQKGRSASGQMVGLTQHTERLTPAVARQAGLGALTGPAVLVTGPLLVRPSAALAGSQSGSRTGPQARAVVLVGSDRVADIFARSLRNMLGAGGSQ